MNAVLKDATVTEPSVREMLSDSAKDFAERELPRARLRRLREMPDKQLDAWPQFSAMGWPGLLVPEDLGGSGQGLHEMSAVLEELGRVAAPEPLLACGVLAATAIAGSAPSALRDTLLRSLASGALVPALAWQSSPRLGAPSEALAEPVRDGWTLRGPQCFVRPGVGWHGLVVSARTPEGPVLLWVPAEAAGLQSTPRTLADGSRCADVRFVDVRVPQAQCLSSGATAQAVLQRALDMARLAAAAELLGVVRGALALSREHLRTRVQFGAPLSSFQALRHRVVDLFLQQELVSASLEEACQRVDDGLDAAALTAMAARVKARASAAALTVCKATVQFHGAMGYTDECDAGLLLKRALTLSAWLGTASELLAEAARLPSVSWTASQ